MSNLASWEKLKPRLGSGGQSEVFKVRRPSRTDQRQTLLSTIRASNPWPNVASQAERIANAEQLANAIMEYARPERSDELGALKVFKHRGNSDELQERGRLKNEIESLKRDLPGLPKLLDSDLDGRWLVTEFFERGSLDKDPELFKARPVEALRALKPITMTLADLHQQGIVHRDIKAANLFVTQDNGLVLGDFGIVFVPDAELRLTQTEERVGPRDHMPPWANTDIRLENVTPSFDVYLLGRLIWCMVTGRPFLNREWHRKDAFNLEKLFPDDPHMPAINQILDLCLVEDEANCLKDAGALLPRISDFLKSAEGNGTLFNGVLRHCQVCMQGRYRATETTYSPDPYGRQGLIQLWQESNKFGQNTSIWLRPWVCNTCGHVALFENREGSPTIPQTY